MKPTQKFYKMPQALFSDKYSQLSNDAKILYMLLLDRKSLSEKNHFNDENGNTVVLYSNDEVCRKIGCGHDKATKLFRELEGANLLRRHRQGKGKPSLIYVNFYEGEKSADMNAENSDTKTRETGVYECGKSACNKTDHNQIEDSITGDRPAPCRHALLRQRTNPNWSEKYSVEHIYSTNILTYCRTYRVRY